MGARWVVFANFLVAESWSKLRDQCTLGLHLTTGDEPMKRLTEDERARAQKLELTVSTDLPKSLYCSVGEAGSPSRLSLANGEKSSRARKIRYSMTSS